MNLGDDVEIVFRGKVTEAKLVNGTGIPKYNIVSGNSQAFVYEDDLSGGRVLYPCDSCGRSFSEDEFRTLIVATSPDGDKISVCQECYDYETSRPEPDPCECEDIVDKLVDGGDL